MNLPLWDFRDFLKDLKPSFKRPFFYAILEVEKKWTDCCWQERYVPLYNRIGWWMMYTFREFANLVRTTIRTLRYYEKIGLLNPIDHDGIKHIDASYVVTYQTIQLLKQANYTLICSRV